MSVLINPIKITNDNLGSLITMLSDIDNILSCPKKMTLAFKLTFADRVLQYTET